jgi:hypothetical protein
MKLADLGPWTVKEDVKGTPDFPSPIDHTRVASGDGSLDLINKENPRAGEERLFRILELAKEREKRKSQDRGQILSRKERALNLYRRIQDLETDADTVEVQLSRVV